MSTATATATTIKLPVQYRAASIVPQQRADGSTTLVNPDTREITFAFSSEAPVKRIDWDLWEEIYEVLSHDPAHANLDRCNNGAAPLLWNHNRNDQRGVVVKAWIDEGDRRGYATVRFGRSPAAEQLMMDVNDGIVKNVSVGYLIYEMELTKKVEGDLSTYTAINWEVFEISHCSIPADASVGVGRSDESCSSQVLIRGLPPKATEKPSSTTVTDGSGSIVTTVVVDSDGNTREIKGFISPPALPNSDQPTSQTARSNPMPDNLTDDRSVEQTTSVADMEAMRRQIEDQNKEIAAMKRREQVLTTFNGLKKRGDTLLAQRKMTTAEYEEVFGDKAMRGYLEGGSTDGLEFHIKQLEKFAVTPSHFGPRKVDPAIPPSPNERVIDESEETEAAADRFLETYTPRKAY
ncbi:HK97 family phage prohead protease [Pantanalinema sp. GBBB05]|uniref:HK97 family phage prohead protease n=1 Tax=Pantanalinema sp. GBBB05 TaxID=2604139 RepID=UPI001D937A7D|nr:hypothetical protein [Pantanalinema sp. GBBB05]